MESPLQAVLDEMSELSLRKNKDYGTNSDPFANVRASEKFNVPPWLGSIIRLNDKVNRISSFALNGKLENESLRDSLIDIAVYGAIAVALYDETANYPKVLPPKPNDPSTFLVGDAFSTVTAGDNPSAPPAATNQIDPRSINDDILRANREVGCTCNTASNTHPATSADPAQHYDVCPVFREFQGFDAREYPSAPCAGCEEPNPNCVCPATPPEIVVDAGPHH